MRIEGGLWAVVEDGDVSQGGRGVGSVSPEPNDGIVLDHGIRYLGTGCVDVEGSADPEPGGLRIGATGPPDLEPGEHCVGLQVGVVRVVEALNEDAPVLAVLDLRVEESWPGCGFRDVPHDDPVV